ncbi:DUF484 family protein [Thauera sp.]|jgi:uncharacterized protein YigA (DUF484 family)|uniref:DUF484 family protein n=1 Tax=Thauera sp. TaxID=1905334 RepID=UPI00261DAECA|nr:DUF484 family protein [Thauera sp.]MCK6407882.1 DUF484 family protein [Thauera sp.]
MNAEEVARYLREHPDFLNQHHELFSELTVPHPQHGGQAISLAERQLHALRDKIRALELKLSELIRFGEENDDISTKVHRLAVALLHAGSVDSVRQGLVDALRDDFAVPHVSVKLWGDAVAVDADGLARPDLFGVSEAARRHVEGLRQPYCGAPESIEVAGWFGEAAPHIRSLALMPLRARGACFGLLALGSAETERFYPGMGTLYLGRIADLAAAALAARAD